MSQRARNDYLSLLITILAWGSDQGGHHWGTAFGRPPPGRARPSPGRARRAAKPQKLAFLATRAAPGRFFGTATCAVFWGRSHGGTAFCATGQLALPRDTTILRTSNLCPSWGPPCDTFFPVFSGTQFSPKFEEMGPCAGQGGDPPPPARRGCAVHTDRASREGDALRRARTSVLIGRRRLRWSI